MYFSGDNIKKARKKAGLTQVELAKKTGISRSSIAQYEANIHIPPVENVVLMAEALDCDVSELFPDSARRQEQIALDLLKTPTAKLKEVIRQYAPVSTEDTVEIPFYEEAVAGAGSEAFYPEYLHENDKISISKRFLNGVNPKYLMFFQIVGDSMEPTIHINDWVLIELVADRDFYPVTGIYLIDMDGSVQLKRLEFRGEKGIDIISDNQAYGTKNTVRDDIQIKIIGKLFMHLRHYGPLALVEKEE